ncbi:hypothetical protein FOXG_19767 [Fusarium oxysporum f. sp. lycopersici 4287]|uniref:Uncharacterized protein n=2 Tax=Fusarium oxysporum TaxID=5507 RepID=A0A0J9V6B0_FUSO4|nr:hypothetical protein FOXG_19767 [Fusarium oxysporum f. sp. lycopersici 4287]EXK31562.1 hypothetical protein FOMG_12099 [Fusarium oxysporum f. sp. melonis 26406]KNB06720.1 hypothetical protein FOXG_19767 [Fusarium oxysporum f. sp. lycopersici 4287]
MPGNISEIGTFYLSDPSRRFGCLGTDYRDYENIDQLASVACGSTFQSANAALLIL